jgi:hypothetical protein
MESDPSLAASDRINKAFDEDRVIEMTLDELRHLFLDSANIFRVKNEDYKERLTRRIDFIKQMIVLRQFEASFRSTRWRSNVAIGVSIGAVVVTTLVALSK